MKENFIHIMNRGRRYKTYWKCENSHRRAKGVSNSSPDRHLETFRNTTGHNHGTCDAEIEKIMNREKNETMATEGTETPRQIIARVPSNKDAQEILTPASRKHYQGI